MRILHVMPGVSVNAGSPRNLIGLVRSLNQLGVDATLVTTNADGAGRLVVPLNRRVMRDGAPHIFHHVWRAGGRWGLAPSMGRTLHRMVATCDLVHIHWLFNFSCIAAARAARAAGVPFVVQPHASLDPHLGKKNKRVKQIYMATVGRPLLREAAAVIFATAEEATLAEYAPKRPEWIVPAGVDRAQYASLPPRGAFRGAYPAVNGPFLLFLGRVSPQKGLDLLLDAFKQLLSARPDLWLVIAGPDYRGYESEVRARAGHLGITHRVLFTGVLTDDLKLAAFVDAELFVLPSYAENFGTVIIEALMCGLPVVISDRVNLHQELAAAGMATVVPCAAGAVAAGIEAALDDVDGRARIEAAGPRFVSGRYTWDAIVPALIASYQEAIAASVRRRAER